VDSHPESKIIITTRIVDVATRAGRIYCMKPLSNDNSKLLFYTRTCGGEEVSWDNQPDEVINKILKKCGGVPLAIITVASLLVAKPSADWSKVYDAIGFGHEDSEVIQNTRKILSFSYYDLPSNLKTCLLYLSMFPEDYFIEKKSLIWRWVIEGFVPAKEGMGSYELGEIYFNKLVNKSMIRWIEPDELDFEQGGCRVHDMVLDLIRTMSSDINFVTVYDMEHHNTHLPGKRTNRVHRLALHGRSVEHSSSIEMKQVRSFSAITCGDSKLPLLLSFNVLRVLVIEDCGFSECHSLEHLGKLVHLRYLGLVKSKVNKLSEGIGHDLKFLQILDVRESSISELPPSVGEL
jgi:disease resistance protein RPM1